MNYEVESIRPLPKIYPYEHESNTLTKNIISAYSSENKLSKNNSSLNGRDLYYMAIDFNNEKKPIINDELNRQWKLKQPKNNIKKLIYGLLLVSPFNSGPPAPGQDRKRSKREPLPSPRHIRTNSQYRLAVYLNKNAAAGINPEIIEDRQLAIRLLNSIALEPRFLPDLARLALSGSRLYGELRGETLSSLQQKSLVGRTLCQLIYQEDNILLRVAKLFAVNRHVTQRSFAEVVQSWPYSSAFAREEQLWRRQYEAPEIPVLFLKSIYKSPEGREGLTQNQTAILEPDNLWVGSLTWTLMQFGARTIVLDDPDKLPSTSLQSLIELGLGLVALFRQGLLASGVEPTLYLGLVLYYLRARPELGLDELLASGTLDPAFDLLKDELERRHLTAQRLYDSFTYYQVNHQRPTWRSRRAAAEELLKQHCGSAQAAILSRENKSTYALDPAGAMMASPAGLECVASGSPLPNVNDYYRREVDRFAGKIRDLDTALLKAVFVPSDVLDDNLQTEDEQFLQRSNIHWVAPRLAQRRRPHDMFYSNVPVNYLAKPDTFFLQAHADGKQRLFALQTSEQGYLLRKIHLDDSYLSTLRPFMADWPVPERVPQHEFTLLVLNNVSVMKQPNETLSVFLERYADSHYQIYRLKIHDMGFEGPGPTFAEIMDTAAGYIVPFYGCVSAIKAGQHQVAFAECLVNGALIGMPLVFTGIKAGSGLFRSVVIGVGRTIGGPRFSASGQVVFKNVVPVTTQISGGIMAARDQLGNFMDVMGKEVLRSVDPGFATLRSLSVLTKGLYLALLCRASLGLVGWQRNLAKVSGDIPKFVVANHAQDFQISYDKDGFTPLTVKVKGVTYPVFHIQNSSMVAVETGERTPDGQLMFAQLDLQNQFGIYKKYYCLYIGSARCQMRAYAYPDFKIEMDAKLPRPAETQFFWLLSSSSTIDLVVVHPFHLLDFADKQWVVFEINGRRWAFSQDNATLMPADDTDDWRPSSGQGGGILSMIEPGEHERSFGLRLTPPRRRLKRENAFPRVIDWGRRLADYTLDDVEDVLGLPAVIHDDATLNVHIGEFRYLLTPEKNAATFLLRHPKLPAAPAFRVAYLVGNGDFVFVTPMEPINAHHIGEQLRQKIADIPQATLATHTDILLPPLFNGAFSYGNSMFLKIGDRFLPITPIDGLYHTLPGEEEAGPYKIRWTLRYELFTGSFDIVDIDDFTAPHGKGVGGHTSRFERLAERTYPKSAFPTVSDLCRLENWINNLPSLYNRLRQTALLLRLDPPRRAELLHATSVALRTFRMDGALPDDWVADFPPLTLWATLVTTVDAVRRQQATASGNVWDCRQLAQIVDATWHFPPPVLLAQRADLRLFIVNKEPSPLGDLLEKAYEIRIFPDRLAAALLTNEGGFRRWLPATDDILPTVVTKFTLADTPQPIFWVDDTQQIWVQAPDGAKTRLYRPNMNRPVLDIIVSPDGGTAVLIVERTAQMQSALFYHLPYMSSRAAPAEIDFYQETPLARPYLTGRSNWVTNQGDLYVICEKSWSSLNEDSLRWTVPEGYQPDFVSPDQRFLGYIRRDAEMHDQQLLLIDIICDKLLHLRRSQPVNIKGFGVGKVLSVAFSALNALAAVGFSDGYIEIYRIVDNDDMDNALSLGHARMPMGRLVLAQECYFKPKQMVLAFDNAFDRLLVFHDIGDFHSDRQGNGTYAVSEIYLADLA